MTGERLERIARRLVREDTYRLIVAPAIADLQFEAPGSRLVRTRAYLSVWRVLTAALVDDLLTDTAGALAALSAPAAMRDGARTFIVVTIAAMVPFLVRIPTFAASPVLLAVLILPSATSFAVLPALTLATREASRQARGMRGFVVAGMAASVLLFVFIDQGVTRANRMWRQAEGQARGIHDIRDGVNEMTVAELVRVGEAIVASTGFRVGYRNHFQRAPHDRVAVTFSCVAYMLFGVALAGVRTRVAVLLVIAIGIAHFLLIAALLSVSREVPRLPAISAWLPTITLTAAAIATRQWSLRRRIAD